jgi:hypothetical protein
MGDDGLRHVGSITPDCWRHIERLYHGALARRAAERAAFLPDACVGDRALQQEIESPLAQPVSAGEFLAASAVNAVAV